MSNLRAILTFVALPAIACVSLDVPMDEAALDGNFERESLSARVTFGTDLTVPFVADDVVASITTANGREELVISGISADRTRSLGLVIDMSVVGYHDTIDLSQHGAVYMELSPSGSDLVFEGTPQGELAWVGELESGGDLSAQFDMFLPAYDRDGEATLDMGVTLDGSFSVHLLDPED